MSLALLGQLLDSFKIEGFAMPYTLDNFYEDVARSLPLEVRLDGISTEERLKDVPLEERLKDIDLEELMRHLPRAQLLAYLQRTQQDGDQSSP